MPTDPHASAQITAVVDSRLLGDIPDRELTVTHRLSDIVPLKLVRIDLTVLAGLMQRSVEKEERDLERLMARADAPPEKVERLAWRCSQRRRLFEQLRAAAGPMYDEEYARRQEALRKNGEAGRTDG